MRPTCVFVAAEACLPSRCLAMIRAFQEFSGYTGSKMIPSASFQAYFPTVDLCDLIPDSLSVCPSSIAARQFVSFYECRITCLFGLHKTRYYCTCAVAYLTPRPVLLGRVLRGSVELPLAGVPLRLLLQSSST
jgi:hypothetical protein